MRSLMLLLFAAILCACMDIAFEGPVFAAVVLVLSVPLAIFFVFKKKPMHFVSLLIFLAMYFPLLYVFKNVVDHSVAQECRQVLSDVKTACSAGSCPQQVIEKRKFGYLIRYAPPGKSQPVVSCRLFNYQRMTLSVDGQSIVRPYD